MWSIWVADSFTYIVGHGCRQLTVLNEYENKYELKAAANESKSKPNVGKGIAWFLVCLSVFDDSIDYSSTYSGDDSGLSLLSPLSFWRDH